MSDQNAMNTQRLATEAQATESSRNVFGDGRWHTVEDIAAPRSLVAQQAATAQPPSVVAEPEHVKALQAEIDLKDTNSILMFGTKAQIELQKVSQQMLDGVKNKDAGPAGESIRTMVTTIKGFSITQDDVRDKPTFVERMMGKAAPIMRFKAKYENVRAQIDRIAGDLNDHKTTLLADIRDLDTLYARTLEFYESLGDYIEAGEARLTRARDQEIPAAEAEMNAEPDENEKMVKANEVRDLRAAADDLERRVHDLKLTRQVTMQSLPSIRLVQENDKSLVTKISSTLMNTVPLWETQLAQALTINRAAKAADAIRGATDLTNELLLSNAKNLRQANTAIRTEMERGVFDVGVVKAANETLIATLEDSLRIADAGKAKRAQGEKELLKLEAELRQSLVAASARASGTGPRI